jgi:phenol hydroxylase P0 protein
MTFPDILIDGDFDPTRKFIRVTERRPDGFVAFDFAIGYPEIFVELVMPVKAFDEFCTSNRVTQLEGERPEVKDSDWAWQLNDVHQRRFRKRSEK